MTARNGHYKESDDMTKRLLIAGSIKALRTSQLTVLVFRGKNYGTFGETNS